MAHQGTPFSPYQLPYWVRLLSGGDSCCPICVTARESAASRTVCVAFGGYAFSYAALTRLIATESIAISPACVLPWGTTTERRKLKNPSPVQPVIGEIVPAHFCTPSTPACVSSSQPSPCAKRFEYVSSQPSGSHGHAPIRPRVRLTATTKSESLDGVFPFSAASGG